jgi:hypothetical protein
MVGNIEMIFISLFGLLYLAVPLVILVVLLLILKELKRIGEALSRQE